MFAIFLKLQKIYIKLLCLIFFLRHQYFVKMDFYIYAIAIAE